MIHGPACAHRSHRITYLGCVGYPPRKFQLRQQRKGKLHELPAAFVWLHYHRYLADGDHLDEIREHETYEARPLTEFFCFAYEETMRCRLSSHQQIE